MKLEMGKGSLISNPQSAIRDPQLSAIYNSGGRSTLKSMVQRDEKWMLLALEEAGQAAAEGEVPIGAVAVLDEVLLARGHNRNIRLNDPTAHAEILVLREAGLYLGNYRLPGVELYVTVEPCSMCAGALVWARISRLVFGSRDEKAGAVVSKFELLAPGRLNHTVAVMEGVCADQCRRLLQDFFQAARGRTRTDTD